MFYFPAVELALGRRSPVFTPGSFVMSEMPTDRVILTGPVSRSTHDLHLISSPTQPIREKPAFDSSSTDMAVTGTVMTSLELL